MLSAKPVRSMFFLEEDVSFAVLYTAKVVLYLRYQFLFIHFGEHAADKFLSFASCVLRCKVFQVFGECEHRIRQTVLLYQTRFRQVHEVAAHSVLAVTAGAERRNVSCVYQ